MSSARMVRAAMLRVGSSRGVRVGFAVLAVALGVAAVLGNREEIEPALSRLSAGVVVLASVMVCAALLAGLALWRALLADLGSPLGLVVSARVLFVSQLGKYLPGSVWPVLAQMELGRDHGVPRQRSATALLLTMLYSLTTGLLVATVTLPLATADAVRQFWWAFLLTPVLLALLHPRVHTPLLDRLLRLGRRPPVERPISMLGAVRGVAFGVVQWGFFGLHVWLLAVALGAPAMQSFPLAVGGFALAWCVGYLFVLAPAGIGVREVALAVSLAPVLGRADAIVITLTSRVIMTVVDLLLAGVAAAALRHRRRELWNAPQG